MILGKDGKPLQKKWEEMDASEQMGSVRQAMGWILLSQEELVKKLDVIAIEVNNLTVEIEKCREEEEHEIEDEAERRESAISTEGKNGNGAECRGNNEGTDGDGEVSSGD